MNKLLGNKDRVISRETSDIEASLADHVDEIGYFASTATFW